VLLEVLEPYPEAVVEVVLRLRERLLGVVPDAHEVVWDATNAVSLVVVPSSRWQDGICHVAAYSRRANLGFNRGAALTDPLGVLQGEGRLIRHVTFASPEEVEAATWIEDYVRAALHEAGLPESMGDRGTTVRSSSGAKRRP
jgi:hypothetical protein